MRSIDGYLYGRVLHMKYLGEGGYRYRIFTEDTKKEITVIMTLWNIGTGDEIELLSDHESNIIARHNITRNIKEKMNETILFPIEVIKQGHELNNIDWRLLKLHQLYMRFERLEELYQKYLYVTRHEGSMWGTRDPNGIAPFKTSKNFFDNARNIYYFYNIIRAREKILEQHDEGMLDIGLFESIIKNFYNEFIMDIKDIPDEYQSIEQFESHLSDVKYKVGL